MLPGPFKPPPSFIKASEERQNKIKQRKEIPDTSSPSKNKLSPLIKASPVTAPAVHLSPKNTPTQIELIKQAREDRRAKFAQYKQLKTNLSSKQQTIIGYKYLIQKFKEDFHIDNSFKEESVSLWNNDDSKAIRVCVRKKPLEEHELNDLIDVISSTGNNSEMYLHVTSNSLDLTPSIDTHLFKFDRVYDENCSNLKIYSESIEPLVDHFVSNLGAKPTFIAYGQTGSGKSFTVFGNDTQSGIVALVGKRIFETSNLESCSVKLSFFEIYGNKVLDLLNRSLALNVLENSSSITLQGLRRVDISNYQDFLVWVKVGQQKRKTSPTDANAHSSRSHAVMQIFMGAKSETNPTSDFSVFTVVDLAGSEKASEANAPDRQSILESGDINKSLLALKECIRALGDPSTKHVPFRASKLTMILRDCLGSDNSKKANASNNKKLVLMMATVRSTNDVVEHSLNTLRYAYRLRENTSVPPETFIERRSYNKMEMLDDIAENIGTIEGSVTDIKTKENDKIMNPVSIEIEEKLEKDLLEKLIWLHMTTLKTFLSEGKDEEEWLRTEKNSLEDVQGYVDMLRKAIMKKFNSLDALLDAVDEVRKFYNLD